MRILALDQASRVSGFAIFEDGKLINYGVFKTTEDEMPKRLLTIRNKIYKLIIDNNIDKVYFEDIQLQKTVLNNVSTFKALSEVIGVISESCEEWGIPAESVHATTWKASIGIPTREKRPIQKKLAKEYALKAYGVKASEDASDAIGIGTYASSLNGYIIPKVKYDLKKEKEIESGFDWSE